MGAGCSGKLSFNSTGKMREIATVGIISKPKIARAVEIVCGLLQWLKRTAFDIDVMSRLHNMHRERVLFAPGPAGRL